MERMHEMIRGWYSRIEDLIDDLKDAGFSVEYACSEYITGWDDLDDGDVSYEIRLGGTGSTITVDRISFSRQD